MTEEKGETNGEGEEKAPQATHATGNLENDLAKNFSTELKKRRRWRTLSTAPKKKG